MHDVQHPLYRTMRIEHIGLSSATFHEHSHIHLLQHKHPTPPANAHNKVHDECVHSHSSQQILQTFCRRRHAFGRTRNKVFSIPTARHRRRPLALCRALKCELFRMRWRLKLYICVQTLSGWCVGGLWGRFVCWRAVTSKDTPEPEMSIHVWHAECNLRHYAQKSAKLARNLGCAERESSVDNGIGWGWWWEFSDPARRFALLWMLWIWWQTNNVIANKCSSKWNIPSYVDFVVIQ